jgi:hypothetical protein
VALQLTPAGREALAAARRETLLSLEHAIVQLDGPQRATVAQAMQIIQGVFAASGPAAAGNVDVEAAAAAE